MIWHKIETVKTVIWKNRTEKYEPAGRRNYTVKDVFISVIHKHEKAGAAIVS